MLNTEGVVKLTDFGVARAVTVKEKKSISGKLPFMSPEQVNKKELDFHTDIYSLGVVLFYMLSGGKTCRHLNVNPHEIVCQAQNNYIDWSLLPDDIDKNLLSILRRMLATDPEKRYHSSSKAAKKLEQYITRTGFGPTSLTLSKYMRHEMPALFLDRPEMKGSIKNGENALDCEDVNETIRIPGKFLTSHGLSLEKTRKLFDSELTTKTRVMSEDEFSQSGLLKK
jgi:serine/threonine protein kinase